ncbi:MAG TPA: ROK family protein [Thermodesulfobacteriota bacterium]|nr:ROK family protein [Thermodesulfobacteriota bacterium]
MGKTVIGMDIGGTNLRGALVTPEGRILRQLRIASDADDGIDAVVENIAGLVNELGGEGGVSGVGIGIAGVIDSKTGVITQAPNIANVVNYPIRDNLAKKLGPGTNVIVENDANCAALGEWWIGAGKDAASLVMITLGTGVGGGIILDGRLWTGADGMGGEVGHMTVYPDGALCNCGNHGCLESYASATAVRRMVREALAEPGVKTVLRDMIPGSDPDDIPEVVMSAALKGDAASIDIWERFGVALGIGMASLVNILNVEMIVLGGGVARAWDMFIGPARAELKKRGLRAPAERVVIERAGLNGDEGILGAAYLALGGR